MSADKLWGGRFKKKTNPDFERFSSSFRWDKNLLPYDLEINRAHVKALRKCGVLSQAEAVKLLSAIHNLEKKFRNGTLRLNENSEDVHSAVQQALEARVGALADKLHTGRSRNDLVSQSARLYCKEHARVLLKKIEDLQRAVLSKAEQYQEVLVPGMTHLQNAQVLSQAHIFLAYLEMFERAKARLKAAAPFFDVCVLGSGALAGVTFDLDQEFIAGELGLSSVTRNSYDVSGDRDFVVNFLSSTVVIGLQISRVAEDLMIAQTRGFSVVNVDEAFCTGSSMMPQKKNADFLELARGALGVFLGNFTGFLTVVKGLPTSYNRDLQWDKRFLFESAGLCEEILTIFSKVFKTLEIRPQAASQALRDETLYATDLADYLVGRGVPFKEAHRQVGELVSFAEEKGLPISKIGLDLIKKFAPKAEGGVYDLFDAGHSVNMKKTSGSTHPLEIKKQIKRWKKLL